MSNDTYQPRHEYLGTGSVSEYTFDFLITSNTHLLVRVTDSNYAVIFEGRGDDTTYLSDVTFDATLGGGTVTFLSNLASGYKLTLLQANDEPTQDYSFKQKGDFLLESFTKALDAITAMVQRLAYVAKRSLRLSDSMLDADVELFDTSLPVYEIDASGNGDKVLAINDTGDGFKLGPTTAQIEAYSVAAQAAQTAAEAAQALAEGYATAADSSADAAAISANSASLSANNAATSETAAEAAQTAAEAAQAAAEAAQTAAEVAAASIDATPGLSGSRSSPQLLTNVTIPLPDTDKYFNIIFVASNGGALNLTASPQIAVPTNVGTRLTLIGCSDTDTVTLEHGSGLELNGDKTLYSGSILELMYDGANWVEISRNGL